MTIDIPEGYESLGLALGEAVAQASRGKGADRHAEKGEPFSDQLIMSIPKRLGPGGECFCLGQALKKICESRRLPPDRARAELLGAINYVAAAWCLLGGVEGVFRERSEPDVSDAPRTKEELVERIRSCNPSVYAPEDRSTVVPLFAEGERVKYAVQGKWEPAAYAGVDPQGKHVVCVGNSFIHLDESQVRKA
jgi:hypothetical protein